MLRSFNHCLTASKSGKSALFRITVNDRFGKQIITLSSVTGWRTKIAMKYLTLDAEEWDDHTVRKFVGLNALKAARNRFEALKYIDQVKSLGNMEVHFWANKFLTNENSQRAWRAFYK